MLATTIKTKNMGMIQIKALYQNGDFAIYKEIDHKFPIFAVNFIPECEIYLHCVDYKTLKKIVDETVNKLGLCTDLGELNEKLNSDRKFVNWSNRMSTIDPKEYKSFKEWSE